MSSNRRICAVVADDQDEARLKITGPLGAAGMHVLEARDGAQAIALVKQHNPNLVVLDAYMPGVNGFLALKTLVQDFKEKAPPVLMVIPNATPRETGLADKLGARGHLKPPFDAATLLDHVRRMTDLKPVPVLTMLAQRPALTLTESRARDEIVRRVEQLPALPRIVQELIRKVHDSDSRTEELEEIIRRDQSLAARVLKLVNSSFFRGQREIHSVGQAVVRLGRNTIQSLALASSTSSVLPVNNEAYGFRPDGLWLHSFSVASAARIIALDSAGEDEANQAFLGGLLHDVGKLILGMMIEKRPDEFRAALAETDHVLEAEHRVFHHSHSEVGDMIGERWKFPRNVRELIRNHHQKIEELEANRVLMAVVLADSLVNRLGLGSSSAPASCAVVAGKGGSAEDVVVDGIPESPPLTAMEGNLLARLGLSPDSMAGFETAAREAAAIYEVYVDGQ